MSDDDREPKTTGDARAVLRAAASFTLTQMHGAVVPEAILLALLYHPAIHDAPGMVAEEERLRRAILASTEPRDAQGWSARGKRAYQRGWQRAYARDRERPIVERARERLRLVTGASEKIPAFFAPAGKLGLGDLIAGLETASEDCDAVLRARALDPERFYEDTPLPEVGPLDGVADDAPVDVLVMNDDVTPMKFVVEALEQHFGCAQLQAMVLMYQIHVRGRARVARFPRAEADRRVETARAAASAAKHPLVFRHGPRA